MGFAFACLLAAAAADAQPLNSVAASLGASDLHVHDWQGSPLVYRGAALAFSLSYLRRNPDGRHVAELDYVAGDLSSSAVQFSGRSVRARAGYAYLRRLWGTPLAGGRLDLFLGGAARTTYDKTDYEGPFPGAASATLSSSYYWAHSLDLAAEAELASALGTFRLRASSAVVSLLGRPDYSISARLGDDYLGHVDAPSSLQAGWENRMADVSLGYELAVFSWAAVGATWAFHYAATDSPSSVRLFTNDLHLGIACLF
ncbi:MAG TPA: hypothetical protein VLW85_14585 [Myxococcales bacterium]|nr:hypothetical protein [Myxococcales bacterium]